MSEPTRRQELIRQMRYALGVLESSTTIDEDECIEFTIAETDFEFEKEVLDSSVPSYLS